MLHPVTNEKIELTKEQQICANYIGEKRKDLVIRSVAGGGKSLVLLQRAINYLKDAKLTDKKKSIALFTYNHVLANYLKEWMQLSQEDEAYIMVGTLHEYLDDIYIKMSGFKLGNFAYNKVKEHCLNEVLDEYSQKHSVDKYKRWGMKFWMDEFTWMRNMNIFDQRDQDIYLAMAREGRGHLHPMDKEDRFAAFEMFCNYQRKLRNKKIFDEGPSGDERILYLTHLEAGIPDALKFDHILIDEAQDQTLAKIIALKKLARLDITICMDANQRIYEGRWRFGQAGIEPTSKKLSYPFRCTGQIDALAESLKRYNQSKLAPEDDVTHVIPMAKGEKPEIISCGNEEEEKIYVTTLIKKWLSDDPIHNIGVMCYKNIAVEKVGRWLSEAHIEFEIIKNTKESHYSIRKPGVKLCTIHTSKGLEFMRVILPQFYQGMIPQSWSLKDEESLMQQRNVAYVGMTRAMHQLVIVYNGRKSRFIDELDPNLYIARTYMESVEREKTLPGSSYLETAALRDEYKEIKKAKIPRTFGEEIPTKESEKNIDLGIKTQDAEKKGRKIRWSF